MFLYLFLEYNFGLLNINIYHTGIISHIEIILRLLQLNHFLRINFPLLI